jgi:alkylhydroperoxidase family enzyme
MLKLATALLALALAACASAPEPAPAPFTARLTSPRLAPIERSKATAEQAAMLASRQDMNIYKTLAWHPQLYAKWSPLGQYLLNGSGLLPRHREMAMLRMGWLCQSPYEWAAHARIAQTPASMDSAPLSASQVHDIAVGPTAPGWSDSDRAVLTMVDELRYDAMISDKTWAALHQSYSDNRVLDLMFTASQYQLVSMALNTLGVQRDPDMRERLPTDVALPAPATLAHAARLSSSRIAPVPLAKLKPEELAMVKERIGADGRLPNLYATLIVHPKMYEPRAIFGRYIQREGLLPPETRELLIMRTAFLLKARYEWAHHVAFARTAGLSDAQIARIALGPAADGWTPTQRAVLQAADDLRREAFVSEAAWQELLQHYDTRQMIEIIYTVGAYTMTAAAINSLGIQVEPGKPKMPG